MGSLTLTPRFDPQQSNYATDITTDDANAHARVTATVREAGQTYTVAIDSEATTPNSGAMIIASTNIGQRDYTVAFGTGGEEVYAPAEEGEEPEWLGTRAVITLLINLRVGAQTVSTYRVAVTRLYQTPAPEVAG